MSRRHHIAKLREASPVILPSLLTCDFANLEREIARLEKAGAKALHVDVMDGYFVPNLTFGIPIIQALRRITELPLDVHLMIVDPGRYIEEFYAAGADILTIHVEAVDDPRPVLKHIRVEGAGVGISINPDTPVSAIDDCLDLCDLVLIMSVEAGFGGQEFNPVALDKLREVRQKAGPDVLLEVDGGINENTIGMCAQAGAQLFVVGTAIVDQTEYGPAVQDLTRLALS